MLIHMVPPIQEAFTINTTYFTYVTHWCFSMIHCQMMFESGQHDKCFSTMMTLKFTWNVQMCFSHMKLQAFNMIET
eukprot:03237.XXX_43471_43698_1 [CDS] Oithona nana genome sequencing.